MAGYLGSYATLGLLLVVGAGVFGVAFATNRVLRPARPAVTPGKFASYECGLDPVGGDWAQAQIRYYLYAYLYVLFAVESVFLFPWAVVYTRPGFGRTAVVEMAVFVGILALGLLYAWRKQVLRWDTGRRPGPRTPGVGRPPEVPGEISRGAGVAGVG